jgi:hypothetical protein
MVEDRLGLIVCGVTKHDVVRGHFRGGLREKRIADSASRIFGREFMLVLVGGYIDAVAKAWDAEIPCRSLDKQGILSRARAHLVVQVGDAQLYREGLAPLKKDMQQCHRIRATRNGDEKDLAVLKHLVVVNRLAYALEQRVHGVRRLNVSGDG